MKNTILYIQFNNNIQEEDKEKEQVIPELFDWQFLNVTNENMLIKLNITNPVYVSSFERKDSIDIFFLDNKMFKAK